MLARNDTRGVRVGFYAKALVRGGQAVQTPCLEHMRVHHCAGCGGTRAKLETLRNDEGKTPLHMLTSTTRGKSIALRVEAAKKMIAAGCDLTVTNDMGVMAYQLMDESDDPEYLELKKTITPSSIFAGGGGGGSSSSS